ncbi:tRNA (adenosine(37)-N6)-threonylcarbamoyltransferase complex ATPase subunit type 1 TsaE [Candidatus Peregrinibacteria bacterium RIFOXYC2_FULL_33_13]|nr:MAG: hypothetical protein UR27_C0001G0078 [Candidatus Peregrinibacteria bacterium GW2011_GWA2_33_10]KKP39807.1 MAG: hypothetical protein UR30_C0008G0076 [Candidatus Peregrinibacteria bacterium GW2011_GWC2_33_13]OGJ54823.1 MAG: tRNA (adenosine(37)-N6)-threonylcarbamoyltransferase complex ATPase subunit type 1 TsaE [Candidatus Peregrinibacteria bacterium RIFOXYC2_FULL_33_13]
MEFLSYSEEDTKNIAMKILKEHVNAKNLILLYGDFGVGKTVFVKGIGKVLGVSEKSIKSPSYTLVREYYGDKKKLIHFDLYRIENNHDLENLGFYEYLNDLNSLVIVEWAQKVDLSLENALKINFKILDDNLTRSIIFNS